jgi:hypothetical protein
MLRLVFKTNLSFLREKLMSGKKMVYVTTIALTTLLAFSVHAEDNSNKSSPAITLPMPPMTGPLVPNPNPISFDAGFLNKIYITGVLSGMGMTQNNPAATDRFSQADITNGQLFIQNTEGPVQFFIQTGMYSIPALGTAYLNSEDTVNSTFTYVPQGYLKLAPNSNFSLLAGKIPTLIGAEYTFTTQNMNIERGLLWNQENAVSRGVQGNLTAGPVALSLSWNDGFYSNRFNWLTGLATYTINSSNIVAVAAGGNLGRTSEASFVTPLLQNNSSIYNLIYTHTDGAWTFNPYIQYTHVPEDVAIGITNSGATLGSALLLKYAVNTAFNLAGRIEYIASSGDTSLLYGVGSKALSFTLTPTYQHNVFFIRGEASYTQAISATTGAAFGSTGTNKSQTRFLMELGVLF